MAVNFDARCLAAATAAADGKLTEAEVLDAFQRLTDRKAQLEASGQLTGQAERLRRFAGEEAERTRIAAAMRRRHAALNAIVRDKLDRQVDGLIAAGMKPHRALLAILEGTERGTANARKSVNALRGAYRKRYVGAMLAEVQESHPHIVKLLRDDKFDAAVLTEMMELRQGGTPGKTGNSDAKFLASTFAKFAEMSRTDLNRLGASIGKLDGWAGVQMHDDLKLIRVGKDAWVGRIVALLDLERTFPDGLSGPEAARALGDIYDTIITGFDNTISGAEKGMRVNPANMAKQLGKSRVLHFKDAEATRAYQKEFGYGNTISGIISHLENSARVASVMDTLGPNPQVMFAAMAKTAQRKVKESTAYSDKEKQQIIASLATDGGVLKSGLDIAVGTASRPVNVTAAKIGADIRAWQSMAKLGGAVISSFTDTVTVAAAAQFRGSNFFTTFGRQVAGVLAGRPKAEQAEIGFLIGEGFDGLIGSIVNPHAVLDGPVGMMGKLQELFFRFNGLTWWTDANRSMAGRMISAEMGMRSQTMWGELPAKYRHVLEMNGIDQTRWGVIRQASLRNVNGRDYVTPDRIRELPDDAFVDLVGSRLDGANAERRAQVLGDARRGLELDVLRFFADETNYAVITTDARTRRYMTWGGLRPGTFAGEAARLVMQFKAFPLAFLERVGGRALFGHRAGATAMERGAHIGTLLAGLTLMGYASMTVKDLVKGYWPPRDPSDPRTWLSAAQQGGALGIYGDFLFSKVNRFGGGLTETLLGPSIGSIADLMEIGLGARDFMIDVAQGEEGRFSGSQALSWGAGNIPFANLFYVKPALDWLFLNSLRETLSPGYLQRQRRTRSREYGQERYLPETAVQ